MAKEIFVYSETVRNIPELITAANGLSGSVSAIVVGSSEDAQYIAACGARTVYLLNKVDRAPAEAYTEAIVDCMRSNKADTLLVSLTPNGRAVAAMVAQHLTAACGSECKSIALSEGAFSISRVIYGGKATSYEVSTTDAFVATIPLRSYEPALQDPSNAGSIIPLDSNAEDYPVKIIEVVPKQEESVDVTAASVLVCMGRGVAKEEDLALIEGLADAVGGIVGCTRPIAMDFHWYPQNRYIGLSGKVVKPKLFIGVGVSGQIQCLAGANDSKVIVGINKDENAPLFAYSDYGVVADLYDFVPALTAAIKSL